MQLLHDLIYLAYSLVAICALIFFVVLFFRYPEWDVTKLTTLVVFIYANHEAKFLTMEGEMNE